MEPLAALLLCLLVFIGIAVFWFAVYALAYRPFILGCAILVEEDDSDAIEIRGRIRFADD